MKSISSQSAKVLVTCVAVTAFFALGLRAARAQELYVEGTTSNSTFFNGRADYNGLVFTALPSFSGTTENGFINFNQPNNNFGTLTFDPSRFVENIGDASFTLRVLFGSPTGFDILPIEVSGGVVVFRDEFSFDDIQLFFFPPPATVAFNGPSGYGVFNVDIDDACILNGVPCPSFVTLQLKEAWLRKSPDFSSQLKEALSRKSRDEIARGSGQSGIVNVGWVKNRGLTSMFAPNLPANKFSGVVRNTQTSFSFTFTGQLQIVVPPTGGIVNPGGCTRGQGFYQANPNFIPDVNVVDFPPFSVSLGYRSYTKPELLSIYAMPVNKNGLIALAQQLATAKLNQGAGKAPQQVRQAINNADALIGNNVVPPLGFDSLSPKRTGALVDLLTRYNEGRIAGAPRCR